MAKKTLNTAAIANELQHSAFFPASVATPASPAVRAVREPGHDTVHDQIEQPVPVALPVPSVSPVPLARSGSTTQSKERQERSDGALITQTTRASEVSQTRDMQDTRVTREPSSPEGALKNAATSPTMPSLPPVIPDSSGANPDASMLADKHERTEVTEMAGMTEMKEMTAMIEAIRKSVRHIGKEVSFVRLTPEEKRQLVDITYTYKSQGIKTSENEISRIGINWMLKDYQLNGQNSVLARVLAALNA